VYPNKFAVDTRSIEKSFKIRFRDELEKIPISRFILRKEYEAGSEFVNAVAMSLISVLYGADSMVVLVTAVEPAGRE